MINLQHAEEHHKEFLGEILEVVKRHHNRIPAGELVAVLAHFTGQLAEPLMKDLGIPKATLVHAILMNMLLGIDGDGKPTTIPPTILTEGSNNGTH